MIIIITASTIKSSDFLFACLSVIPRIFIFPLTAYSTGIRQKNDRRLESEIRIVSKIFTLSFRASSTIRKEKQKSDVTVLVVILIIVSRNTEIVINTSSAASG